jgi:predicted PurR-regulated permease PerM
MRREEKERVHRYIFIGIILILVFLSFLVIRPYIIALVSSFILAFLVKPLFDLMKRKTNKPISALISILLIVLIVLLPLGAIISGVISQAQESLNGEFLNGIIESLSENILKTNIDTSTIFEKSTTTLISLLTSTISYLPSLILSLLITLLGVYYILINWEFLDYALKKYIPFDDKERIADEMAKTTKHMVYGTLLVGALQSILSFIVFYLLGIQYPLLLSSIIFIFAFIPAVGPAIVWAPLALYYLINQDYTTTIILVILGLILSVYMDTVLRSKLSSKSSNINPLVMIIGILGGVSLFGIFGFIIGPLILAYTLKLIENAFDVY